MCMCVIKCGLCYSMWVLSPHHYRRNDILDSRLQHWPKVTRGFWKRSYDRPSDRSAVIQNEQVSTSGNVLPFYCALQFRISNDFRPCFLQSFPLDALEAQFNMSRPLSFHFCVCVCVCMCVCVCVCGYTYIYIEQPVISFDGNQPLQLMQRFQVRSQNCDRPLLASSYLPVRPHRKTRLPLDAFSWNLIIEDLSKICQN
jgi:hypothetical protein